MKILYEDQNRGWQFTDEGLSCGNIVMPFNEICHAERISVLLGLGSYIKYENNKGQEIITDNNWKGKQVLWRILDASPLAGKKSETAPEGALFILPGVHRTSDQESMHGALIGNVKEHNSTLYIYPDRLCFLTEEWAEGGASYTYFDKNGDPSARYQTKEGPEKFLALSTSLFKGRKEVTFTVGGDYQTLVAKLNSGEEFETVGQETCKQFEKAIGYINGKIKQPAEKPVQEVSAPEEILKYKQLLDMGVITPEEFEAKKKQLLGL